MKAKHAYVCVDCNSYVRDFLRFLAKTRTVTGMFEDLELLLADRKVNLYLQTVLKVRLACNLPVPNFTIVEPPSEDDFAAIEEFPLDDGEEVEYLLGDDEIGQEPTEVEAKQEFEFTDETEDQYEDVDIISEEQVIDEYVSISSSDYNFQDQMDNDFNEDFENLEDAVSDDVSRHFK